MIKTKQKTIKPVDSIASKRQADINGDGIVDTNELPANEELKIPLVIGQYDVTGWDMTHLPIGSKLVLRYDVVVPPNEKEARIRTVEDIKYIPRNSKPYMSRWRGLKLETKLNKNPMTFSSDHTFIYTGTETVTNAYLPHAKESMERKREQENRSTGFFHSISKDNLSPDGCRILTSENTSFMKQGSCPDFYDLMSAFKIYFD